MSGVEEHSMPSPIEVYIENLKKSGILKDNFLLSLEEKNAIANAFLKSDNVKIKRGPLARHSIIKDQSGQLYAICSSKDLGPVAKGVQGVLKLAQNVESGELCLVKRIRIKNLATHDYARKEAEQETKILKKRNLSFGNQHRSSEKYQAITYDFIKILPGIMLCNPAFPPDTRSETLVKYASQLSVYEQSEILLNILKKLDELKSEGIIHRDLHGGNILIDPITKEVNIIDFGLSLDADQHGFCIAKHVSDVNHSGKNYRFANGFDLCTLGNYLPLIIHNKPLLAIYNELEKQGIDHTSHGLLFNSVDITPAIQKVLAFQEQLKDAPSPKR